MDMENNTVILSSTQTINISTCHKWINTWMKVVSTNFPKSRRLVCQQMQNVFLVLLHFYWTDYSTFMRWYFAVSIIIEYIIKISNG